MNSFQVSGHLGQDAKIIKVGDKQVVKFPIASKERNKTIWFNVDWWTPTDHTAYMRKGDYLVVSGRIDETDKDGRKYQTVIAQAVEFVPKHHAPEQQPNDLPY